MSNPGSIQQKVFLVLFLGFWTLIETRNMGDRCHYKKLACPILSWPTQSLGDPHGACLSSLFYLSYQVFPAFMTFLSLLCQTFFLTSARRYEHCSLLPLTFQNSLLQHIYIFSSLLFPEPKVSSTTDPVCFHCLWRSSPVVAFFKSSAFWVSYLTHPNTMRMSRSSYKPNLVTLCFPLVDASLWSMAELSSVPHLMWIPQLPASASLLFY